MKLRYSASERERVTSLLLRSTNSHFTLANPLKRAERYGIASITENETTRPLTVAATPSLDPA